jgi:triacylglycerol lipase
MKNFKKTLSLILAMLMIMSCCSLFSFAEEKTEKANNYPFVLVHGLGGWGQYDAITETAPYWGSGAGMSEGSGDFVKLLRDNGYEAYAVSVGPVNSAWDRVCEIYAQLTGTVVDYGAAHSKAHNHERYGRSFEGKPLMGRVWSVDEPINLIGHSFGGPASRLFASLMTYGDEAEIAATGSDTSPLFTGGHSKTVHSVITLSGCHNGSQIANLVVDPVIPLFFIAVAVSLSYASGNSGDSMYSDMALSHFGLSPDEATDKVKFSFKRIFNYLKARDNAGVDLTVGGSQKLNEKIKMSPDTYYYSVSGTVTEENKWGRQEKTHDTTSIFNATTWLLSNSQGLTIDGIKMDKEWANNDGMVPLKSALYPIDEKDNAFSYEEAFASNSIKPGSWYYTKTIYGMDHGDYCGTTDDYPEGYEKFWLGLADMATSR